MKHKLYNYEIAEGENEDPVDLICFSEFSESLYLCLTNKRIILIEKNLGDIEAKNIVYIKFDQIENIETKTSTTPKKYTISLDIKNGKYFNLELKKELSFYGQSLGGHFLKSQKEKFMKIKEFSQLFKKGVKKLDQTFFWDNQRRDISRMESEKIYKSLISIVKSSIDGNWKEAFIEIEFLNQTWTHDSKYENGDGYVSFNLKNPSEVFLYFDSLRRKLADGDKKVFQITFACKKDGTHSLDFRYEKANEKKVPKSDRLKLNMFLYDCLYDEKRDRNIEKEVTLKEALREFNNLSDAKESFIGFHAKDGFTVQFGSRDGDHIILDIPNQERGVSYRKKCSLNECISVIKTLYNSQKSPQDFIEGLEVQSW